MTCQNPLYSSPNPNVRDVAKIPSQQNSHSSTAAAAICTASGPAFVGIAPGTMSTFGASPHVTASATAAALIRPAQIHPNTFAPREFVRVPITFLSLVSSTTKTISGGASTPFTTADQNNIFTAFNPAKSSARPTTIAPAMTI